MSSLSPRTPVSDEDRIAYELKRLGDRLDALEAPSGTSIYQTVEKLRALIDDIQAQLDAWVASRWTNAQVQSAINSSIASTLAGSVTIGGNLLVNGTLRDPDAVAFNITGTRRTVWIEDATGRFGYATSTIAEKAAIRDADEERLMRLLDIVPKTWIYRAEVRRRTALRINEGIDYVPARELGLIAEELDDAGFHEFVIYNVETGKPEGVEYSMIVVALLGIARSQRDDIAELRAAVAEIREAIG